MIKPVMSNMPENQMLSLIIQKRSNSLRNHRLFKYSMFSAPGAILAVLRADPYSGVTIKAKEMMGW